MTKEEHTRHETAKTFTNPENILTVSQFSEIKV